MAAVRRMESQLLAGELRETLIRSNQWGVVRLVPTASSLTPVSIRAAIVLSDGRDLVLDVVVKDLSPVALLLLDRSKNLQVVRFLLRPLLLAPPLLLPIDVMPEP